ncbi:hypothetical protein BV898_12470 [Hypsibius exemplaris]|uniref:Protein sleepless n=1 Tax=Hypsibius exemplaris TaxID=2072580 RepID=A0A1W0WDQ5_HYPEX|nr:hypothetical protein BV898_12470 [Hypsibius exemplaris]
MTVMVRTLSSSLILTLLVLLTMLWDFAFAERRRCYECTSGVNDGCDDPARLIKWASPCPEGTQGCLKMKAPGSPLTRSCGNPYDSPVPIRDGCVNKPGVGIICSCSSGSLCNAAPTPSTTASPLSLCIQLGLTLTTLWIFQHFFLLPQRI